MDPQTHSNQSKRPSGTSGSGILIQDLPTMDMKLMKMVSAAYSRETSTKRKFPPGSSGTLSSSMAPQDTRRKRAVRKNVPNSMGTKPVGSYNNQKRVTSNA